ncbi:hypothetical protein CIHG_08982 [Coccidioides immitis H538.4]|uniref:Uncharacterized protein n=1 Tax=Coccidioides immitis H538.4 TaxID=396776 RepID=A0A0J8S1G9_COCIT|nr:hypothetical protein CIHG_08982 [Coccidioides immitis H538.4]
MPGEETLPEFYGMENSDRSRLPPRHERCHISPNVFESQFNIPNKRRVIARTNGYQLNTAPVMFAEHTMTQRRGKFLSFLLSVLSRDNKGEREFQRVAFTLDGSLRYWALSRAIAASGVERYAPSLKRTLTIVPNQHRIIIESQIDFVPTRGTTTSHDRFVMRKGFENLNTGSDAALLRGDLRDKLYLFAITLLVPEFERHVVGPGRRGHLATKFTESLLIWKLVVVPSSAQYRKFDRQIVGSLASQLSAGGHSRLDFIYRWICRYLICKHHFWMVNELWVDGACWGSPAQELCLKIALVQIEDPDYRAGRGGAKQPCRCVLTPDGAQFNKTLSGEHGLSGGVGYSL